MQSERMQRQVDKGNPLEMLLDLAAVQAALNEGDEAPWMVGSLSVFSRVTHAHA